MQDTLKALPGEFPDPKPVAASNRPYSNGIWACER